MSILKKYGSALGAVAIALVWAVQAAVSDGRVTPAEWVQVIIALATAAGVYLAPLWPGWPVKTLVAAVLAAANVLVTIVGHGFTAYDWSAIVLAVLQVVGTGALPAQSLRPVPASAAKLARRTLA